VKPSLVHYRNLVFIYFGFAFLCIAYFALNNDLTFSIDMAPFCLLTLYSYTRMAKLSKSIRVNLVEIVFLLFIHVWLGVAPMLQVMLQSYPLPFDIDSSDMASAGWLVVFSLFFYFAGSISSHKHLSSILQRKVHNQRFIPFSIFAISICVFLIAQLGPKTLFTSRQEMNSTLFSSGRVDNSIGAITSAALCVPIFVALLGLIQMEMRSKLRNILLIVIFFLNVLVNNPVIQSRFWFVTVWGSIGLALFGKTRFLNHKLPVIVLTLIFLIFPNADIWRYANSTQSFTVKNPVTQLVTKGDFDSAQQVAWGVKISHDSGFEFGQQILGATLFYVPRSVWTEKPVDTGILLARKAGYSNTSLSAPLWIEGYIDFGLIGTFTYLFLLGKLHSVYRRLTITNNESLFIYFPLYQLVVLRGSLIQSMAFTAVLLSLSVVLTSRKNHEVV